MCNVILTWILTYMYDGIGNITLSMFSTKNKSHYSSTSFGSSEQFSRKHTI